jgi:hypothetical protein
MSHFLPEGVESEHWSKEMLLLAWQQQHQDLNEAQKKLFLENINVEQILSYPSADIAELLPKHQKLDSLRAALWHQVNSEWEFIESLGDSAPFVFEDNPDLQQDESGSWF